LKPSLEKPEQAQQARKGSSILNGSQASSPISEAITASNIKNIKFDITNNKLDQLLGTLAKMAANGIRIHGRTNQFVRAYGFKSHSQPILLTYPEADLTYYF